MKSYFKMFARSIFALCVMEIGAAQGQTTFAAQGIMNFLNIGIGAKAAGMGYSFITDASDPSDIFWNPAGLARLNGTQGFLDINDWIADIKQYSFAFSQDLGNAGVLGLSFTSMDYGTMYGTTIDLSAATTAFL